MARETYSSLLQSAQDLVVDPSVSSTTDISATSVFLARHINDTIGYIFGLLQNYKTLPTPKTMSTVADQIYYHYPPGMLELDSVTMTIGDIAYPLKPINSQAKWNELQQLDITSSDVPQYYFPRQSDFGIYPTPSAVRTVTVVASYLPRNLATDDYVTGTVASAQNSQTLTGTNTTWTSGMVGRWFCETNSSGIPVGNWYRIGAFGTTTSLTLESVFEESALSGATYVIAESPELPEELHQYIPFRAAANYLATQRRNPTAAQPLLNYFFTGDYSNARRNGGTQGGVLGVVNRYKNHGSSNSQINELHKGYRHTFRNEAWATVLSES